MAQRSLNHETSDAAASGTGRQINPDGPVPCYSELILKEGSLLSDKTMADPSTSTTETALDKSTICAKAEISTVTAPAEVDLRQQTPSRLTLYPSISQPIAPPLSTPPRQQTVNRCLACRKRVGLLGFKCRCGDLFCATHRYSDKHDCSYDYRAAGRAAIAKQNPIVKAGKIEKI